MKKFMRLALLIALCFVVTHQSLLAADKSDADKSIAPDPNANPILAQFMKDGAKLYYLGKHSGLDGWFLTKDNQIQIVYAPADNQTIISGAMYDAQGNNVTSLQMKILFDTNKEVHDFLTSSGQGKGIAPSAPMPSFLNNGSSPSVTPPSPASVASMPGMAPGERLIQTLQQAAAVNLGAASAPKLFMIADPNCPYCQSTWKMLRAFVFGGKLQIHLVPVDAVDPDSARAAAQFLHSANPLDAWDKYIAGDKAQLAGTPDATTMAAIRGNHAILDAWHISMTPYMIYQAKNGQTKIVQGKPDNADDMVNDIAP